MRSTPLWNCGGSATAHRALIALAALAAALAVPLLSAPAAAEVTAEYVTANEKSFSRPRDLALSRDGRYLFVADGGNNVVRVLDPKTLEIVGTIGGGALSSPHDVAVDADGRLLVADSANDRIAVFILDGAEGDLLAEISGQESPQSVAVGPGGRIYVANRVSNDVQVWDERVAGRVDRVRQAGRRRLDRPHDVDIGADGRIYVADSGNNRILVLDRNHGIAEEISGSANAFKYPHALAIGPRGWLFVADRYGHAVKLLDDKRKVVLTIGTDTRGRGTGRLSQPGGVAVSGDVLWIADTGNNRVIRYRLTGLDER